MIRIILRITNLRRKSIRWFVSGGGRGVANKILVVLKTDADHRRISCDVTGLKVFGFQFPAFLGH